MLAKVMEGFACNRLLPKVDCKIDMRQYARKGHSTTDALLYMLQAIYEGTNSGDAGLQKIDVDEALLCWIRSFLTNRRQAVTIGGNMPDWKALNGGVPQGTKL